jgi:hypothetical protein
LLVCYDANHFWVHLCKIVAEHYWGLSKTIDCKVCLFLCGRKCWVADNIHGAKICPCADSGLWRGVVKSVVELCANPIESFISILWSGSPTVASERSPNVIVILIPVLNSVENVLSIESNLHLLVRV